jgi:peptidoglycan/xylan/chitin deacetylase (PgdA/CDA1 family)
MVHRRDERADTSLATDTLASFWGIDPLLAPLTDDDATFRSLLLEETSVGRSAIHDFARRSYYTVRPLLPRTIQIRLRQMRVQRIIGHVGAHWPVDRRGWILACQWLYNLNNHTPHALYGLRFWPAGAQCAVVLTHDVEQRQGFDAIEKVAALEEELGFRSSWNIVPERYPIDRTLLRSLVQRGHEIGVHGLYHDGKLFSNHTVFRARLEKIADYAVEWGARGFRSPATLRHPAWMQELPFEYDASFFDTDPFEPQPGGCSHVFPFLLGRLVELPYTMPQDHTLFEVIRCNPLDIWLNKAKWIRSVGGMILMLTHPDYLREPSRLAQYRKVLEHIREWDDTWRALPIEAAHWWRRRHASSARVDFTGQLIAEGPAREAVAHSLATIRPAHAGDGSRSNSRHLTAQ